MVAIAGTGLDLTGKFTVTENHQGAPGLAHGGLLSLAFDEALGKLMWLIRTPAVTGRLETDFLMPVPMGRTLYIDAKITGQAGLGHGVLFVHGSFLWGVGLLANNR